MNKKFISVFAAAAVAASSAAAVLAENTVKVVVDGSNVEFEDQQPIIENDRTLIPVRGAFEAMGGKVDWDAETRTVTVRSSSNTKQAVLTIDSDVMTTYTYKSLLDVEKKEVKLDVPAKIVNDRTILPLRAIGEALGAVVDWDADTYTASITTKEITENEKAKMLSVSLSQVESENDDEVIVSVDIANLELYPESYVSGVTVGVNYDPEAIEFVSASLYNGDTKLDDGIGASNGKFTENRLKSQYAIINEEAAAKTDGSVMKIVFKKLKDELGSVSLSNSYRPGFGYDTGIVLTPFNDIATTTYSGTQIVLDTAPLELK